MGDLSNVATFEEELSWEGNRRTCTAPPVAPVLLANVVESMRTWDASMDKAPAELPVLEVKFPRRICTVEFWIRMLPGTSKTTESIKAISVAPAISTIALLSGVISKMDTPPNLLAKLNTLRVLSAFVL
jgi:hypothetical protein